MLVFSVDLGMKALDFFFSLNLSSMISFISVNSSLSESTFYIFLGFISSSSSSTGFSLSTF